MMKCFNWLKNVNHRTIVSILGATGCGLLYILRTNLSVAIVAMVNKDTITDYNITAPDLCYERLNTTDYDPGYTGTYEWSESLQGIILGAYFYTYCLTQVPGGRLTERFGAKWVCAIGLMVPAIFNALIPVATKLHVSLIIILRLIIGAFHGVVYSSLFSLYTKWFPKKEITFAIAGTTFGGTLGAVIVTPLTGYLCKSKFLDGWPSAFYITTIIHIIWFALWWRFVHSSPSEDPTISEEELSYISRNLFASNNRAKNKISVPWKSILTSAPVWASVATKVLGGFGYFLLCIKMPKYLDSIFGMAIHTNGWFNAYMYLAMCVSLIIGGPLSTYVKYKGWITSLTTIRKLFQAFAMISCGLCLVLVPVVECNKDAVIALLLFAMFFYGFNTGGEYAIIPEYAPDLSGTVFGFANTFATTTGFIAPLASGFLLDAGNGDRHQWNIVWYLSAAFYFSGALIFGIFGTAKPQSWAVISSDLKTNNQIYAINKNIKILK